MPSCNSSSIISTANNSNYPTLTAQQSQAARDLIQVEDEMRNTVQLLKKLKVNKNDTWIQEHISLSSSQTPSANVYPKYSKGMNYYQEFWRTYLMNEMMISKIKEFSSENKLLDVKIVELEVNVRGDDREYQKLISMKNKKKNRRTAVEIQKSHICPYVECQKLYGSEVSLNLHIKLKHNGGNKTERERLARSICMAQETGEISPDLCLNFPPGYLDEFKSQFNKEKERYMKMESGDQSEMEINQDGQGYIGEVRFEDEEEVEEEDQDVEEEENEGDSNDDKRQSNEQYNSHSQQSHSLRRTCEDDCQNEREDKKNGKKKEKTNNQVNKRAPRNKGNGQMQNIGRKGNNKINCDHNNSFSSTPLKNSAS